MECYRFSNSRFDIKSNGLISALPFIAQSFVCFFGGWITDIIITKKYLKTITVRKINTSLGLLVPAVTVVLAGKWLLLFHMMDSDGSERESGSTFWERNGPSSGLKFWEEPKKLVFLVGLVFSATNTTSELNMGVCYREHMLRLLNAFVICQDFSSNFSEKPKQPRARIFKARSILTNYWKLHLFQVLCWSIM